MERTKGMETGMIEIPQEIRVQLIELAQGIGQGELREFKSPAGGRLLCLTLDVRMLRTVVAKLDVGGLEVFVGDGLRTP
ncbi:MAG: hypothetical protein NUV84_04315 [Candidatus Uhrbacteria bacterium]|nr:hypothetical protein [Candidatus Uhrbacteria bacterium]